MNELDGVDGKSSRIITILTTNRPEEINPGMRRPGRIDVVLDIKAPNAETVQKMVQSFAGDALDPQTDLTGVGQKLAGKIPACIREAVRRARLEALRRTGDAEAKVTTDDLIAAADEVVTEDQLFRTAEKDNRQPLEELGRGLAAAGAMLSNGNHRFPVTSSH
jgi:transitional endoplasmic reticulum ATPase